MGTGAAGSSTAQALRVRSPPGGREDGWGVSGQAASPWGGWSTAGRMFTETLPLREHLVQRCRVCRVILEVFLTRAREEEAGPTLLTLQTLQFGLLPVVIPRPPFRACLGSPLGPSQAYEFSSQRRGCDLPLAVFLGPTVDLLQHLAGSGGDGAVFLQPSLEVSADDVFPGPVAVRRPR